MRSRKKFAKVFVATTIPNKHRQNSAALHGQVAANNWPNTVFARGYGKSLSPINSVAIKQCHRRHSEGRRRGRDLFRKRASAQKAKGAAGM